MLPRERVIRNFLEKYGRRKLERLLEGFNQNVSNPVLGKELGVSRERVRQWKNLFGSSVEMYVLNPEILELAKVKAWKMP